MKSCIGRGVCSIKPNNIERNYLLQLLLNNETKWGKVEQGSTFSAISSNDVKSLKLLISNNIKEQKVIAHVLSLLDTAISKHKQLIAQKQLRKKWLMQVLLTGKKRIISEKLKVKNKKWREVKLGDVFEFVKSYSISRVGLSKTKEGDSIFCIHYGDIHTGYESTFLDFNKPVGIPKIIDNRYKISKRDLLKEGDIILADASEDYDGVGEIVEVINLNNKNAIGGLHTIVLRCNSDIIANRFKGYLFKSESIRNTLRRLATGTSVYSVTKTTLHNLSFIIPNSIEEQTAIAQVLQTADKEIELLKSKTEKLKEQKKGLMQVLLTGKKRLKQDL